MAFSRGAFLVLALALACPASIRAQEPVPAPPWISLFDGTLDGWLRRSGTATFTVEDHTIVATTAEGSGHTFLCTTRQFANFELEFEVKVDSGLNSGVIIRSKLKPLDANGKELGFGGRVSGPRVEIADSAGRAGWIHGEATGSGWLSPDPKAKDAPGSQLPPGKPGDWNHFRIVAQGARIQTFLNGTPVADLTHPDIFQNHTAGCIALEVQGIPKGSGPFQVRWRHLQVRELP